MGVPDLVLAVWESPRFLNSEQFFLLREMNGHSFALGQR
jgi:hypothetical protein